MVSKGDGEKAPRAITGAEIDILIKARILMSILCIDRLAGKSHSARDTQVSIKPQDLLAAKRDFRPKLALFPIEEKKASPIRLHEFSGFLSNQVQKGRQIPFRTHFLADFENGEEFLSEMVLLCAKWLNG